MELPELTVIKAERVTDQVYQLLRTKILNQEFAPGQKLSAEELASRLGVSRTPVHDAFVLLATEGLVEIIPRRGTFVTDLTVDDIAETMDVRRALELLACETAVQNVTDADLRKLRALLAEMKAAVDATASPAEVALAHNEKNLQFHEEFVRLSGNRRLIETYRSLNAHLKIARTRAKAKNWKERLPREQREHDEIVRALEARDVEALKAAVDHHLRRAKQSLIADLQGQPNQ